MGKINILFKPNFPLSQYSQLILSLLLTSLLSVSASAFAKVWNVDPEGISETSLVFALETAKPGDTILLSPGEYIAWNRLIPKRSGEPDKPIIIKAAQYRQAAIKAGNDKFGFYIEGKAYIVIENLHISGFSRGCGVKIINSHHIELKGLEISGSKSQNISIIDSYANTIEKCEVYYSDSAGIYIHPQNKHYLSIKDNVIKNNKSHNNRGSGLIILGYKNIIKDNYFQHNGHNEPLDHGLYCLGKENIIEGNECTDNAFGSGIRVGGYNIVVKDNLCINNLRSGIIVAGKNPSRGITITGNVLENNIRSGIQINASKYKPSDVQIVGNHIRGSYDNIVIQKKVLNIYISDNTLIDPHRALVRIDKGAENAPTFLNNRFLGSVCTFNLMGKNISGGAFFPKYQQNGTCSLPPPSLDNARILRK